jgi:hypothetical protein
MVNRVKPCEAGRVTLDTHLRFIPINFPFAADQDEPTADQDWQAANRDGWKPSSGVWY